jgi:MerR family transcriptional regulator, thiopeptide resistance regulator
MLGGSRLKGPCYKIQEFAELSGVTVKALRHYDRLGLLKPGRTGAGYRVYTARDLERLEQIVALKFLGIPLKRIKAVLDRAALTLPDALRLQRKVLEEKEQLLHRAIRAIQEAEKTLDPGKPADPAVLKKIIEVTGMQDGVEAMKKYYTTEASWERHRRYYEEGPALEWRELYRDAAGLLDEDPAGEKAQALVERWFELSLKAYCGDPELQIDSPTAWMDRERWPPVMRQRLAEFRLEQVTEFINHAAMATERKHFSEAAWNKLMELRKSRMREEAAEEVSRSWQARVDLFHDIEAAMTGGEDPAGGTARALADRWRVQLEEHSGGNTQVQAGLLRTWADRRNWPAVLRWRFEGLYRMPYERMVHVVDFIERATECCV